ncbi:MAG TPA: hypothetical protein VFE46_05735 [Pirellulales bacterium]|jgi:tetratricopeptide (TPR) repeat protein|nr:hypothetical protein [Pirellulales bacterium]
MFYNFARFRAARKNGIELLALLLAVWAFGWGGPACGADSSAMDSSTDSASGAVDSNQTPQELPPSIRSLEDVSAHQLNYPAKPAAAHSPAIQGPAKNAAEPAANASSATDGKFSEEETSTSGAPATDSDPSASIFATTFDDPPSRPTGPVEPASFSGVQPGVTTMEQLTEKWGKGEEVSHDDNQTVLHFTRPTFPHVEVTVADGKVRSIVIDLDQAVPTDVLAQQLQLTDVRPVDVPDDSGELLGQAYPERGVLFSITPDGKRVSHVVLDKIDLSTFALRAEVELQSHTRASLADLDYVLAHQSKNARALWLRGRLMAILARYDEAADDVEAALEISPKQPLYHLTHAEILSQQGHYNDAAQEIKNVMAATNLANEIKARALCELGDIEADSPVHDYKSALEHHQTAIKLADPLSIDKRLLVRRAAKLILIDAHLAVAHDVACGFWQEKETAVPKWLGRAQAYVDDFIAHEDEDPGLRLHLALGALRACAGADGKVDSIPWARMALKTGKPLIQVATDPWTKDALQWTLGIALADGLMADELHGAVQHALPNTALTITYLETGAKGRRETPADVFRLGWLYYRMGSLHALQRNDHKTAIAWYEKAFPLLDRPLPATLRNQQGHYGEWLVSMGISYWNDGNHDFALQLTDAGVQHIQEAVKRNLVDEKSLAIPYGNLAFMHEALGHKNEAQNFAQLAAKYDSGKNGKR